MRRVALRQVLVIDLLALPDLENEALRESWAKGLNLRRIPRPKASSNFSGTIFRNRHTSQWCLTLSLMKTRDGEAEKRVESSHRGG